MHDPVESLQLAFDLLKPNGALWIATPNIDSFGHAYFGLNWRGIEPPRHLVIFNFKSLMLSLKKIGFHSFKYINRADITVNMFTASEKIQCGFRTGDEYKINAIWPARIRMIFSFFLRSKAEFINVIVRK